MNTPFPIDRLSPIPEARGWERRPALASAWHRSGQVLHALRESLTPLFPSVSGLRAVSASGSLGRRESVRFSDADLIVLVSEDTSEQERCFLMTQIRDILTALGLPHPKASGIFYAPITVADLLNPSSLGRVAEDVSTFGLRIQLLLDAQPIVGSQVHQALTQAILRRYDGGRGYSYLRDDLIRYFRSLCVEAQWDFGTRGNGWYVRDLKRCHSRVLLYAALVLALGELGPARNQCLEGLSDFLPLTPLERVARISARHDGALYDTIADSYNRFLHFLDDSEARAVLASVAPRSPDDMTDTPPPLYEALRDNARDLSRAFTRFVLDRSPAWGMDFVEDLLF